MFGAAVSGGLALRGAGVRRRLRVPALSMGQRGAGAAMKYYF
ncbi:hypothetical protein [Ruminococcus sp.]|nr:hypothetical protein [Ruminococcus sp.]